MNAALDSIVRLSRDTLDTPAEINKRYFNSEDFERGRFESEPRSASAAKAFEFEQPRPIGRQRVTLSGPQPLGRRRDSRRIFAFFPFKRVGNGRQWANAEVEAWRKETKCSSAVSVP